MKVKPSRQAVPKPRAAVAFIHSGEVRTSFAVSMLGAFAHEMGTRGVPFATISEPAPSGDLAEARNRLAAYFLDHAPGDWLWVVDTDMSFEADCLTRLIDAADPTARPVVGALCFGQRKADTDPTLNAHTFQIFPTIYRWVEREDSVGFQVIPDYPPDELVPVAATGAACFVVHRTVLERIRDKYGPCWFSKITHPTGRTFSEDLSFFVRVAGIDAPALVHTGIRTAHDKGGIFLTAEEFDKQQVLASVRG